MSLICLIPNDLIDYLCACEPMLAGLTPKQQFGIAWIVWVRYSQRYKHKKYPLYFSIHCRDLESLLGRNYKHIISMLGLMTKKAQWSVDDHTTCAWELLPRWLRFREQFLIRALQEGASFEFVEKIQKKVRRRKNGIRSRDASNNNARTRASIPFGIPVNLDMILEALTCLRGRKAIPAHLQEWLTLTPERDQERLDRIKRELMELWILAHSTVLPTGVIPQEYVEVDSGRLFGQGVHLQSVCREVKAIALGGMGLEEYDFSNCHFAIFAQLAEQSGYPCPAITDYLKRKQEVRNNIAQAVGIPVKMVKQCLLMTLYGSNARCPGSEFVNLLQPDELERLKQNRMFSAIHEDIKEGRRAILKHARKDLLKHVRWHSGGLTNVMRKKLESNNKARQLAHILQGFEARMLNIVAGHYGPHLRLLQHDGFVSSVPINVEMICEEILKATGLVMQLEKAAIL